MRVLELQKTKVNSAEKCSYIQHL